MIVGRGFTSNNASKENNRIFYYACIRAKLLKMKLQRMNGELGEGGEIKIIFSSPTFCFAPTPLKPVMDVKNVVPPDS